VVGNVPVDFAGNAALIGKLMKVLRREHNRRDVLTNIVLARSHACVFVPRLYWRSC
jgi:hypothetical protein